eukprot:2941446-Lingulodinium_polyedra.AAC.1
MAPWRGAPRAATKTAPRMQRPGRQNMSTKTQQPRNASKRAPLATPSFTTRRARLTSAGTFAGGAAKQ